MGGKKLFSRMRCLLSLSSADVSLFTVFLLESSGGLPVKQNNYNGLSLIENYSTRNTAIRACKDSP